MYRLALIFVVVAACGGAGDPQPVRTGSSAAAVIAAGGMHFYFGQPGIAKDMSSIESGTLVGGGWTRIATPQISQDAHFDLTAANPALEFWHSFGVAPGCIDNLGPYVGKWTSGQLGVSGTLDIAKNSDATYNVSFDFAYVGDWDLPCGHMGGEWYFNNQYLSIPTPGTDGAP